MSNSLICREGSRDTGRWHYLLAFRSNSWIEAKVILEQPDPEHSFQNYFHFSRLAMPFMMYWLSSVKTNSSQTEWNEILHKANILDLIDYFVARQITKFSHWGSNVPFSETWCLCIWTHALVLEMFKAFFDDTTPSFMTSMCEGTSSIYRALAVFDLYYLPHHVNWSIHLTNTTLQLLKSEGKNVLSRWNPQES